MKKVFSVTEIHQKSGGGKDLYHRSIQCPWMGRFNILKVSVFSKLIYEYNRSLTKIPLGDSKFLKNSQQNSGNGVYNEDNYLCHIVKRVRATVIKMVYVFVY